ncbi:VIT1/CCC1 transporter family protein [Candidatus Micrarchaeota archaeon]|nr:VIT1/CCC1 transporter family protein [Candidatus Micrarchaeota archaeon]
MDRVRKMRIKELFQGIAMGLMDGLITLLGIIVGVGVATNDAKVVIISGLVGGISNSFGTSIGFYTSENAERGQQIEFYKKSKGTRKDLQYIHSHSEIIGSAVLSFIAGAFAIVFPLLPFFLLYDVLTSMISSLIISAMMLFVLGYYIGKINETDRLRSGFKYLFLGIMSSIVAFILGEVLRRFIEGKGGIF